MAGEMAAMWRTANGFAGVAGRMSHTASDAALNQNDVRIPDSVGSKSGGRSWIPSLERMPPVVQFIVRATQWLNTKCRPSATPVPQMRLVAQLALGAKRHVSLVEVAGVQFLIGGGVEHVTVIVPIPKAYPLAVDDLQNAVRPL